MPDALNSLLVTSSGETLFAAFVILFALALIAVSGAGRGDATRSRLMLLGVAVAIATVIALIGMALVTGSGSPIDALLPPLERALTVACLVVAAWALIESPARIGQIAVLAALAAISAIYLVQSGEWASQASALDFNASPYSLIWIGLALVAALVGGIGVILRAPVLRDVLLRLIVLILLVVGQVVTLAQIANGTLAGDAAGIIRLSALAALALLIVMGQRATVRALQSSASMAPTTSIARPPVPPPPAAPSIMPMPLPVSTADRESAQLMRALGLMLENASPRSIPDRVGEAVMNVMKADITVMIRLRGASHADIVWGRDRVMEKPIPANSISLDEQPTLVNAIERRQQRPLFTDRNVDELRELYGRFDIEAVGPTYFQPLVSAGEMPALLVVGLPYSRRELTDSERELLRGVAIIGAKLLALSEAGREAEAAPGEALPVLTGELDSARAQVETLTRQIDALNAELAQERTRIAATLEAGDEDTQQISQRMDALVDAEQQAVGERDRLAQRVRTAETVLIGAVSSDNEAILKSMIDVLNDERADLLAERDRLQAQIDTLRSGGPIPSVVHDLLERMSREKAALERDKSTLRERLTGIEDQLIALGVTDGAQGLSLLIQNLYEQRAALQVNFDNLKAERDLLLRERQASAPDEALEKQLKGLQVQMAYLAADREAAIKQRDRLRSERDELASRQRTIQEGYSRLMAEVAAYEQEVTELRGDQLDLRRRLEMAVSSAGLTAADEGTARAGTRHDESHAAVMGMLQELRTPLTSVIGYVDLLLSETAGILGEMQRRFLARVASNSSRLAQMLEDVARLTTLDTDEGTLIVERVNPIAIIETAITQASPQLRERAAVIALDLEEPAPAIRGDKDAVLQIVTQLVTNAYLASPYGGEIAVRTRIGAEGSPDAGRYIIALTDQGGGIDPTDMPRVFARRYRADNPLIQGVGDTGVGLAIAKTLTEAHGGRIWAESSSGVGTTFSVALPIDPAAETTAQPA